MESNDEKGSHVGRPSKYNDKTIKRLCEAIADGMPIKGACVKAGIGVRTLNEWRDRHPEVEERMDQAREQFREKALQTIKSAIKSGDWRASVAALKLVFEEYREGRGNVNVAVGVQVALPEAERVRLIARRDEALRENSQYSNGIDREED